MSEQQTNLPAIPEEARYSNAPTTELQELAWTARALVNAVTVPKAIQGKPGDILAVMLAGRELGIGPMAATRMVHIINGQTSVATELKLALALKAGHDIAPLSEGDGWCQVNCRTHPESTPVGWMMIRQPPIEGDLTIWTVASEIMQDSWEGDRDNRRKVSKPLTEKDNWRNYQRDMLFWRAASQFMRRHCPGLAGGLYTLEELGEGASDVE
jgi:hypothetical protein